MGALFFFCVRVVLNDSGLAKRAALYLPSKIAHYILYEAVCDKNLVIVEKLVENWPHQTLSLDFASNSLCRWKIEQTCMCIKAPEFYKVTPSVDLASAVCHSIAIGLFSNVYKHFNEGKKPSLQQVDMSTVIMDYHSASILASLIKGEMAGDASTTLSEIETTKILFVKDKSTVSITLYINISLHPQLSTELLTLLSQTPQWSPFKVAVTGVSIMSNMLTSETITKALDILKTKCTVPLKFLQVNLNAIKNCKTLNLSSLVHPDSTLWFYAPQSTEYYTDIVTCVLKGICIVKHLIITSNNSQAVRTILTVAGKCKINSLSLLKDTSTSESSFKITDVVKDSQMFYSDELEYLQIHQTTLTSFPLNVLLVCSKLHVLSIVETDVNRVYTTVNSPSDCFRAISSLSCLQYLEWVSPCNVRTTDILALHQLLSNFLPNLQHCHLYMSYILLFTTDVSKVEYAPMMPLLLLMLVGLRGDESCSTFRFNFKHRRFVSWLSSIRPCVCVKCGNVSEYKL